MISREDPDCDHVWSAAGIFSYSRPHSFSMEFGVEEADPCLSDDPYYEPPREGAARFSLIGLPRLQCALCGAEEPHDTPLDYRELWRLSRKTQREALVRTRTGWKASITDVPSRRARSGPSPDDRKVVMTCPEGPCQGQISRAEFERPRVSLVFTVLAASSLLDVPLSFALFSRTKKGKDQPRCSPRTEFAQFLNRVFGLEPGALPDELFEQPAKLCDLLRRTTGPLALWIGHDELGYVLVDCEPLVELDGTQR